MAGIVVISAPRSGSSCTSGLIHLHGYPLGPAHTLHADQFNRKGYFENEEFLNFNRKVLNEIGVDVFCRTLPDDSQIEQSLEFSDELRSLFDDQFGDGDFLIKDPRIAILQDLYLQALPEFKAVLLHRKREDVARSINRMRGDISVEEALRVVDTYSSLIDQISSKVTEFIKLGFESIIECPSTVRDLCEWIGVEYKEESVDFVEGKLVNFK